MKRLIVCLLTVMLLVCGCAPQYPAFEGTSEGHTTLTYSTDAVKFDYIEGWNFDETTFTFTQGEGEEAPDITVGLYSNMYRDLNEQDMESYVATYSESNTLFTVDNYEMKQLKMPVIYMEASFKLTEDNYDSLLESGALTESMVESYGGKEAIIEKFSTPVYQSCVFFTCCNYSCLAVGAYANEAEKQDVLDQLATVINTLVLY